MRLMVISSLESCFMWMQKIRRKLVRVVGLINQNLPQACLGKVVKLLIIGFFEIEYSSQEKFTLDTSLMLEAKKQELLNFQNQTTNAKICANKNSLGVRIFKIKSTPFDKTKVEYLDKNFKILSCVQNEDLMLEKMFWKVRIKIKIL